MISMQHGRQGRMIYAVLAMLSLAACGGGGGGGGGGDTPMNPGSPPPTSMNPTPPPTSNPTPPPTSNPTPPPSNVPTGSVTLTWMPPTSNTDGSSLLLGGYKIVYGTTTDLLDGRTGLIPNSAGLTTFVLDNVPKGPMHFAIVAVSTSGVDSVPSNIATATVN